jgi:uncharacterized membrane protein YvbJ
MYCTNCGTWGPDEVRSCPQCGNAMPVPGAMGLEGVRRW